VTAPACCDDYGGMSGASRDELCFLSAVDLRDRIARAELSPVEAVEAFLHRIGERNPSLGAYVNLLPGRALDRARAAERAVAARHELGALHGVPIAVKDEDEGQISGLGLTLGVRALENRRATEDSVVVERLEAAGAIILGKTNLPELGHKGTTDNLLFGPTRSPFGDDLNAGGSSGGSAAAVADGLAAAAQGSDGGGSIRIPAALSGCYGLKPSFGRVPFATRPDAFYHTPFSSAGPLTRSVGDAALMLDVMAGPDERDPFSLPHGGGFRSAISTPIDGARVAYSPDLGTFPVTPEVRELVEAALVGFEDAGASVQRVAVDLGHSHERLADVWRSQISLVFAATERTLRADGIALMEPEPVDLPDAVIEYIERGRTMNALDFKAGDVIRSAVFDAFREIFETFDYLVTPTTCVASVPNDDSGETVGPAQVGGVPVDPLIGWCLTFPVNFTGHPAASMPAGLTPDGVPVGLQLIGPRFGDAAVLAASAAFERARPWQWMYTQLRTPQGQKGLHVG
jgi:Asp-tRNA(Asn)/Glu-tRNA(Gln) amidotransferase A subunit family amidase